MSASDKVWLNNNLPDIDDVDLNGFNDENINLIVGSNQAATAANNQQTHEAVARYTSYGNVLTASGTGDAIVLSLIGNNIIPLTLNGMSVRWQATASNTGAVTLNVPGIGILPLRDTVGGVLSATALVLGSFYSAVFNLSANEWWLVNLVQSSVDRETVALMTSDPGAFAGQFVTVEDYATGNKSGVLFFKWVAGPAPAPDGGSQIDHDTLNLHAVQNFPYAITVKMFGAKADGLTDEFAIITAANDAVAVMGRPLFFTAGVYAVSIAAANPLRPTTSWVGNGATIKNTNLALIVGTQIARMENLTDVTFSGITWDGQITITGSGTPNQDQPLPSDANADDYTQLTGPYISNGKNVLVENCHFKNFWRNALRSDELSESIRYVNCTSDRNRGTFGDGFYAQRVRNVAMINCRAYDFTRIGFVYEGVAASNQASDFSSIQGCFAEFAHDNVSTENNCGFWVENSTEINISDCQALNTISGFVLAATDSAGKAIPEGGALSQVRTYNMANCTALGVKGGLSINPDNQSSVFNITNFNGHIAATTATANGTATQFVGRDVISVKMGVSDTVINLINCGGYVDNDLFDTAESYGFLGIIQTADTTTQKIINVKSCSVEFSDPTAVRTDAALGNGKGFYHCIGSVGMTVILEDCHEIGSSSDLVSLSITSYDQVQNLTVKSMRPQFLKSSGDAGKIRLADCPDVVCDVTVRAQNVRANSCDMTSFAFNSNDVRIANCEISRLFVSNDDPVTRFDAFTARSCNFNGDLATVAACSFSISGTRTYSPTFYTCTFHNSAGAINTETFIDINNASGAVLGSGNIFDDRVADFIDVNGIRRSNPKTETDSDMPFGLKQVIDA